MQGRGSEHQIRLREGVSALSSFFDQQPPLQHDVFGDIQNAILEHGPKLVIEPIVQLHPPVYVLYQFDSKTDLGKGYDADVEKFERLS